MEFAIKNLQKSINDLMRTIGYQPAYFQKDGEVSIVRQLTRNDYPRFHLYIKEIASSATPAGVAPRNDGGGKTLNFSLHLDQKKPSYEGSRGHSGEYDGDVVEGEAERIKRLVGND
ncbi:MAG: hypothetical protein A3D44_00710 [Candidatus Staskawiczbacteria bacterium RIFCSPHIGHO2_02_FULL_42_22]|uniref:Uncharacterized protein n=1 Tax=Candidatus Staskawiczbacteria bacterium RIFCSPHIGHO2_02_FULL_42_22 TaxID=1802207 RepID=A0A1G2I193_9BACT|nr:MAG: hypothetical protein A3D44_00710 [Candidatus Staskawiczbacteria bacterium RIFCSPHIGHO2_02_FULL_42_22]